MRGLVLLISIVFLACAFGSIDAQGSAIPQTRLSDLGLGSVEGVGLTDKPYLIASGAFGTRVYDPDTLETIFVSDTEVPVLFSNSYVFRVNDFAWSPDSLMLAVLAGNQQLYLWDAQTQQPVRAIALAPGNNSIDWSPAGDVIAVQSFQSIGLLNVQTGNVFQTLNTQPYIPAPVDFSSVGRLLAYVTDFNTSISVDAIKTNTPMPSFVHPQDFYYWSVAFSPDDRLLATGLSEGGVALWDVSTGKVVKVLTGLQKDVYGISWSADGKTLVASSADLPGTDNIDVDKPNILFDSAVWDVETGNVRHYFSDQANAMLSPDGTTIVAIRTLNEPENIVNPDGSYTVRYSANELVFEDAASGEVTTTVITPNNTFSVDWSFDGSMIATGNGVVTLWH